MIQTVLSLLSRLLSQLLIILVRGWQVGPSRMLPPTCRYTPSCSTYAIGTIRNHGPIKGVWWTTKRLLRCHPWAGYGYDPVPPPPHTAIDRDKKDSPRG